MTEGGRGSASLGRRELSQARADTHTRTHTAAYPRRASPLRDGFAVRFPRTDVHRFTSRPAPPLVYRELARARVIVLLLLLLFSSSWCERSPPWPPPVVVRYGRRRTILWIYEKTFRDLLRYKTIKVCGENCRNTPQEQCAGIVFFFLLLRNSR